MLKHISSRFQAHSFSDSRQEAKKIGHADGSVMIKEWVYSGISADVVDMALNWAIADGGIQKLYYADYEQTSYFGFVTIFSLVAYGE